MLYRIAWTLCRTYLAIVRRVVITGVENIPARGGIVLVSNHKSYWDPVVIGCTLPMSRHVYFMAKHELFKIPLLGPVIAGLGAFPVKRGGADRSAIRTALSHLESGRVVGIFPEGTRNKGDAMMEPHLGAAMLSTRASVPVLPVAVMGTRGFFGKINIIFGKPMSIQMEPGIKKASRKELSAISSDIMDSIAGLMALKSGDII
ncbi:MAG: 1-acyl-sn-glycerol-3-phosphate acyltransferase [Actinobacteria bacterium]|nr:1-acyl-sn-glycerol-3-phosphate acyltransferase [Actinomycetota bacterium]